MIVPTRTHKVAISLLHTSMETVRTCSSYLSYSCFQSKNIKNIKNRKQKTTSEGLLLVRTQSSAPSLISGRKVSAESWQKVCLCSLFLIVVFVFARCE